MPWPCTEGPGVFEIHFQRSRRDAEYGVSIRGPARRCGAQPGTRPGDAGWGYGVVGVALVGHGQLDEGDNFTVILGGCPGECFPAAMLPPEQVGQPLGTTVEVYGDGFSEVYYSNMWLRGLRGCCCRAAHLGRIQGLVPLISCDPLSRATASLRSRARENRR